MKLPSLEIVSGQVERVQLSNETHVSGQSAGKHQQLSVKSRVINKMRVFVQAAQGERDFTFSNSSVGVREGHRISVVLARKSGLTRAFPIILHNHSTGQREEFIPAIRAALATRAFDSRWRATGAAIFVAIVFIVVASFMGPAIDHFWPATFVALLSWPVLWGAFLLRDAIILPQREKALLARLRSDVEKKLAAQDETPPPAAPAP